MLSSFIVILIVGVSLIYANAHTGAWYAGNSPPLPRMIAGVASKGDYYINLDTNTVYQYTSGTWTETSNVTPPSTNFSDYGVSVAIFIIGFIGLMLAPVIIWSNHRT